MKRYSVFQLKEGMKLSKDVNSKSGATLVPKGVILSKKTIKFLINWGIKSVLIEEEEEQITRGRGHSQAKFKKEYFETTEKVISFMEGLKGSKAIELDEVKEIAQELVTYSDDINSVKLLTEVKDKDYYTYQHSINVGIYASLLGRWLGYCTNDIKNLSLAGLLHDIGKTQIPDEVLLKPESLTDKEFEIIKNHPIYGYELLKPCEDLSPEINIAVLQHHERENGSGYPFGITGEKIHSYSKIISVVDIFDAITSNRVYKGRNSPFEAIREVRDKSFQDLNPEIAYTFFKRISEFFVGSTVIFNDGSIGKIVFLNKNDPTRPLVQIEDKFVDLSKHKNREIIDVMVF
ncbi:HD-GYP domain-containing protein [Natranaerobius thermophilus]|uniref:Metal dependent phosphohydrolase n=1 Tax=Natranaerobius thermophilus (strain ATCC BAA-1301 / DSM 18059 / JW/NM-WN-LF) TaxID=457570 RepID=B2A7I2_NATTJ|nr:HD-GYP domain-containing protein [Natranaerobius thermophilus]ACB85691.1 metal dependent phosphohydrolase [Natranaerobius thermophilus JW/NM-WN-LF]